MYQVYGIKLDGMTSLVGIINRAPAISWRLRSDVNGISQESFSIKIFGEDAALVAESGEIKSTKTSYRFTELSSLCSNTCYDFEVSSRASDGQTACQRGSFITGHLDRKWDGNWIEAAQERKPENDCKEMWKIFAGIVTSNPNPEEILNPAVNLRQKISLAKPVKKAYYHATAHGIYDLYINGHRVSEPLAPGYTPYAKYIEVQQYDVTDYIEGDRILAAVTLADGWYTGKIELPGVGNQFGETNAFLGQLDVIYEDGSCETFATDSDVLWHESEYQYADLIVGTCYRAGFIEGDWKLYDFDDSNWERVLIKDYDKSVLEGRLAEPVAQIRKIPAKEYIVTPKGELVIDFGENIAGLVHINFDARAGQRLKLTHSEVLDKEGNFLMNIMGQNKNQADVYVCNESGQVDYQPSLTFHGYRYVLVEGIAREQINSAETIVYGTRLDTTGSFTCSDERLNKLQECIFRSQQGNMISIPTDCPQRERAGWTGDMQVYAPTACFNMDVKSFLEKWLKAIRLEQLDDGQIPNTIPYTPSQALVNNSPSPHICSAAWGDACIIIPYVLYQKYGDKQILADNFDMIYKWMKYAEKQASTSFIKPVEEYSSQELEIQKYLWNTEFHFGEWLYPSRMAMEGATPFDTAVETKEYVSSAYFAYTSELMRRICEALGRNDLADYYKQLNEKIRWAFAAAYIDEEGRLPINIQGMYVLALQFNLYPNEELKQKGIGVLEELIKENGYCLDTGFSSVAFLLDSLYDNGLSDMAYKLLFQENAPSWLYEVKHGATTIWENWVAILPDGTPTNSSYNHFAFGCVGDFIYRKILGIKEHTPGYESVTIAPDLECGLTEAHGSYETPFGLIKIDWQNDASGKALSVVLPPSVTAEVQWLGKVTHLNSGSYTL